MLASSERGHTVSNKYHLLDAFRGLACLGVLVFHATLYGTLDESTPAQGPLATLVSEACKKMFIGVPIFFVISGYCITASSESAMRREHPLRGYFKRRFRRIYPPYWTVLCFTGLLILILNYTSLRVLLGPDLPNSPQAASFGAVHHLPHPSQLSAGQWVGNLTLTETWLFYLRSTPSLIILPTAWTLCYEEQFYAVCALLLLAPAYYYRGTGLITLLTLGVLGSKLLSKLVGFPPFRPVGLFIDGPWLMFAMGVFVFWVIHHRTEQRRKAMGVTFLLGGLLVTAQVLKPQLYNYLFVYSVSVVFTLLLLIFQPYDRALSSLRPVRMLAWMGEFSYSLYLVHSPITELCGRWFWMHGVRGLWAHLFIVLPITATLSLVLSRVFYLLVERRFLNRTEKTKQASLIQVGEFA